MEDGKKEVTPRSGDRGQTPLPQIGAKRGSRTDGGGWPVEEPVDSKGATGPLLSPPGPAQAYFDD